MAQPTAADRRRAEILDLVSNHGFIRIADLTEKFSVTPMTIHRDLDELDDRGLVHKVRSGVKAIPLEEIERNVTFRRNHLLDLKKAVARAAEQWIRDEVEASVIALDDSTTVLALADLLAGDEKLTLVTNFKMAIDRITEASAARLIAIGGTYSASYQSFYGLSSVEAIRSIQVDVACVSATSVWKNAVYHPDQTPIHTKRAMLQQADRTVLLVDHSKFSRRALHRQAALDEFDLVVVDEGISDADLRQLRDSTARVRVAELPKDN